jgi:DNA-binding transcriptional LysR family regulator
VQLTDHAIERARLADTGHAGSLVVGYFGSVIFGVLPRILREFREQNPDADLILERAPKNVQADAIRDGRMHVGFARRHGIEPGLAVRSIPGEPLYVAVPTGHRSAGTGEVTVSALAGAPMALFPTERPSFADEVTQLFARSGTPLSVAREAEDVVTALAYVAAARLCAVVPGSATHLALPGVEFVPLADSPCEPLSCLYRPGDVPAPLGALLRQLA